MKSQFVVLFVLLTLVCHAANPLGQWEPGRVVTEADVASYGLERCFAVEPVPDSLFAQMQGCSYSGRTPVKRSDLRCVRVLHRNFDSRPQMGLIVCNKLIANDLCDIMRELYGQGYQIQSILPVERYGGDDHASMAANNSSCFNCRTVKGKSKLSRHAYGMAFDLNPLYNPHVRRGTVNPAEAAPYADRSRRFPHKISATDAACRAFKKRGFRWGGDWRHSKDYQHFEK